MRNILAKELKLKFIETLILQEDFTYEDGNPFLISIYGNHFYVFLKNISPAYFINSPDVTRVQLPQSDHFKKISKTKLPFIILGYDIDNDVFVAWNHNKIKDRLNAKSNVSLYSRLSLQKSNFNKKFISGYLTNGEKIIVFKRDHLVDYFMQLNTLFTPLPDSFDRDIVNQTNDEYSIYEISDKLLINKLTPLLESNRVLEAVEVCSNYYSGKYVDMKFKDWFNLVSVLYRKIKKG
ncbi:MAG: hypothetical protein J0M10_09900 [Chitinophagales bacterium]|nr:hypothetical protein [Chitinophagales bacterium]